MNSTPRRAAIKRGQRLRVMSRWAQFVALGLGVGQPAEPADIVSNLRAQPAKLYHLGDDGQPLVARAGQRRAALHALRSVVRPSAESLPATGAEPRFPLQAQAVCGRCVDHRLVSGAVFTVGAFRRIEAAIRTSG